MKRRRQKSELDHIVEPALDAIRILSIGSGLTIENFDIHKKRGTFAYKYYLGLKHIIGFDSNNKYEEFSIAKGFGFIQHLQKAVGFDRMHEKITADIEKIPQHDLIQAIKGNFPTIRASGKRLLLSIPELLYLAHRDPLGQFLSSVPTAPMYKEKAFPDNKYSYENILKDNPDKFALANSFIIATLFAANRPDVALHFMQVESQKMNISLNKLINTKYKAAAFNIYLYASNLHRKKGKKSTYADSLSSSIHFAWKEIIDSKE